MKCRKTLDLDSDGRIRNDLAVTFFHLGDRDACRKTLEPLAEDAAKTDAKIREELPPSDADILISIARATRTNLKLCGKNRIAKLASEKSIDTTVAEAYEQHMVPGMFRHWTELQVGLAAPKAGEQVLDVACGTGIGARLAAAHVGPTGRAVGIDIDPGVIELARQLSRGGETPMEWHCASALEMPLESDVFDLALCLQGLQFFPDRLKGFAEIRRVLKPSGRLVASFWGPLESNKGHHVVVQGLERLGVDAAPAKRACSFSNAEEIRATAAQAGFAGIELRTEDGVSQFGSIQSFLEGMTRGSPSTRHAVAKLSADARERFVQDVREALQPYVIDGVLAYPMRTHVLVARAQASDGGTA